MSDNSQKKAAEKYLKVLEKYGNDPNKVAEAYAELEEKFGAQGSELGDLRKKSEDATNTVQQYADYVKNAKPIVDWYSQNQGRVQELWNQAQQPQNRQTSQQSQSSLLTQDEQQALINAAAQYTQQQVLGPWSQKFAQEVEKWATTKQAEMTDAFEKKQKAFGQVWWKTLEHAVPQDKIAQLRLLHEEATKYADPSKIDPFKFAEEAMDTKSKLAEYEEKIKKFEKERDAREKASIPSLGNNQGLFPKEADDKQKTVPKTRDDRFGAVLDQVKTTHGNEGISSLFGPAPLR